MFNALHISAVGISPGGEKVPPTGSIVVYRKYTKQTGLCHDFQYIIRWHADDDR